jgi:hypothetical protein
MTTIRVYPNENEPVFFEFPLRPTLRLAISEAEGEGRRPNRVRSLRRFLKSLDADETGMVLPHEYVTWFLRKHLLSTKSVFSGIYCPRCEVVIPKNEIVRQRWSSGERRRGNASEEYYACPNEHKLYLISRRVS